LARALFGTNLKGTLDLKRFKVRSLDQHAQSHTPCLPGFGDRVCRLTPSPSNRPLSSPLPPPLPPNPHPITPNPNPTQPKPQPQAFLNQLHDDVTRLEYAHYDSNGDGYIKGVDFANSIAAAADVRSVDKYLDRVSAWGGWG